ncbi:MAG: hypothetical protein WA642_21435 [Steroidobacteraceae bacterium]
MVQNLEHYSEPSLTGGRLHATAPAPSTHWSSCMQGQLSTSVIERITRPGTGLFPSPKEIAFSRAGEGGTPVQKLPDGGRILDSSKLSEAFGIDFGGMDAKPSHRPSVKEAKSVASS